MQKKERKKESERCKMMNDDQKEEIVNDLLPILEKYDIELINEIIGNVRI